MSSGFGQGAFNIYIGLELCSSRPRASSDKERQPPTFEAQNVKSPTFASTYGLHRCRCAPGLGPRSTVQAAGATFYLVVKLRANVLEW